MDWLSASLPWTDAREAWAVLRDRADRICRFSPVDGTVEWETTAWDSVRSDSHQVVIQVGSDCVRIQGSPARSIGDGCAVFGSGASSSLDLVGCLAAMVGHVNAALDVLLPVDPRRWKVTRVDVTDNLLLDDLNDVRAALRVLRDCEGGRYRVSQQAGDSVYWSQRSTLRAGKAYAKGPHLAYLKKRGLGGREYTDSEIDLAGRLLRLELSLKRHFWARADRAWYEFDAAALREAHADFFGRMVGDSSMDQSYKLRRRCIELSTPRQGASAYATFLLLRDLGYERVRESMSKPTFYRHLKILRAAGAGDADIAAGRVVEFRRVLAARPVASWDELRAA